MLMDFAQEIIMWREKLCIYVIHLKTANTSSHIRINVNSGDTTQPYRIV